MEPGRPRNNDERHSIFRSFEAVGQRPAPKSELGWCLHVSSGALEVMGWRRALRALARHEQVEPAGIGELVIPLSGLCLPHLVVRQHECPHLSNRRPQKRPVQPGIWGTLRDQMREQASRKAGIFGTFRALNKRLSGGAGELITPLPMRSHMFNYRIFFFENIYF